MTDVLTLVFLLAIAATSLYLVYKVSKATAAICKRRIDKAVESATKERSGLRGRHVVYEDYEWKRFVWGLDGNRAFASLCPSGSSLLRYMGCQRMVRS